MLLLDLFEDDHPKRNADLKKAYQDAIYQDYADDDIKADAFLTKHYSNLVVALNKFASGDRIYRGVEDKNFSAMVVDPTKAVRCCKYIQLHQHASKFYTPKLERLAAT